MRSPQPPRQTTLSLTALRDYRQQYPYDRQQPGASPQRSPGNAAPGRDVGGGWGCGGGADGAVSDAGTRGESMVGVGEDGTPVILQRQGPGPHGWRDPPHQEQRGEQRRTQQHPPSAGAEPWQVVQPRSPARGRAASPGTGGWQARRHELGDGGSPGRQREGFSGGNGGTGGAEDGRHDGLEASSSDGSRSGGRGSSDDSSCAARAAAPRRRAPQQRALQAALSPRQPNSGGGSGGPTRWVSPGRSGAQGSPRPGGGAAASGLPASGQLGGQQLLADRRSPGRGGRGAAPAALADGDAEPIFSLAAWDYVR